LSNATFKILGPVQVRSSDGGEARLSGKQRALLVSLLLHIGTLVPRQRLVAALWETPPRSAFANLQTYIAQLRRVLPPGTRLVTGEKGYLLEAFPEEVDLLAFEQAVRSARAEHERVNVEGAVHQYERALSLWRGRVAEGTVLAGPALVRAIQVEEQRTNARLNWAEAKLSLSQPAEVIEDFRVFVAEQPLHERAWHLLILALSQAGRRAEALSTYRQARATLISELGIEPGPALRGLQYDILSGEMAPPRRPICQLPADIADFVGRERELARISALCSPDTHAPPVVIITGPPGVGKSTLAVHAAHLLRAAFPDGHLYLRLGAPSPRDPAALLAELLRALNAHSIPDSTEERATLYRSMVADRSMLIVLEDATSERQITPLLPGTSPCAVLVTSRGPLPPLPGSSVVQLAVPSHDEARTLLERVASVARVRTDPEAAAAIVRACGRLPLAIRVAGARLVTRPAWPLRDLADRLASTGTLDELSLGGHGVRANFAISYEALPAAARRSFRLLGLTGLRSTAEWVVAALMDSPRREAEESMEALMLAGLVTEEADQSGQPRYRMHDLLAAYARERAHAEEDSVRQGAALARFTSECLRRLRKAAGDYPPPMIPSAARPVSESAAGEGSAWLHAERETLITAVTVAEPRTAAELAHLLSPFLVVSGFADEATAMLESVVRRAPDRRTAMVTRLLLADIALEHRRVRVARPWLEELADHFAAEGDQHAELYVLTGLGTCHLLEGDPERAWPIIARAIAGFEARGDTGGLVNVLITAVGVRRTAGEHDEAIALCHRGLGLTGERRYGDYAVRFHRSLGISLYEMGRIEDAIGHYEESIGLSRELGWGPGEQITLRRLGEAYGRLGRFEQAATVLARCRDMFVRTGDVYGEALTDYTLGELSLEQHQLEEALSFFTRCHQLTEELDLRARAQDRIDALSAGGYAR
jgi:DNA-binding SARP family transcriptional activator/energy-coupling factor transporter ATP-binding protein EcfA2